MSLPCGEFEKPTVKAQLTEGCICRWIWMHIHMTPNAAFVLWLFSRRLFHWSASDCKELFHRKKTRQDKKEKSRKHV